VGHWQAFGADSAGTHMTALVRPLLDSKSPLDVLATCLTFPENPTRFSGPRLTTNLGRGPISGIFESRSDDG
jgi:hypothetical protein